MNKPNNTRTHPDFGKGKGFGDSFTSLWSETDSKLMINYLF